MERGESQYLHSSPNLLASLVPINGGTPLITMMFDHEDSASVIMCKCASVIMCKCDHVQMCKCGHEDSASVNNKQMSTTFYILRWFQLFT